MIQESLDDLIRKIEEFVDNEEKMINKKNNLSIENSRYLCKNLQEIKDDTAKIFNNLCDSKLKENDKDFNDFLYDTKRQYNFNKIRFIELICKHNTNFEYEEISKIIISYDIIKSSIILYLYAIFYNKEKMTVSNFSISINYPSMMMCAIYENIISSFSFIVHQNFFQLEIYFNIEDKLEYWKDLDLKKYFELKEFWCFSKDSIEEYLNKKIITWKNILSSNIDSDLIQINKILELIKDKLMKKKLISRRKANLWIKSITDIKTKIKGLDENKTSSG